MIEKLTRDDVGRFALVEFEGMLQSGVITELCSSDADRHKCYWLGPGHVRPTVIFIFYIRMIGPRAEWNRDDRKIDS